MTWASPRHDLRSVEKNWFVYSIDQLMPPSLCPCFLRWHWQLSLSSACFSRSQARLPKGVCWTNNLNWTITGNSEYKAPICLQAKWKVFSLVEFAQARQRLHPLSGCDCLWRLRTIVEIIIIEAGTLWSHSLNRFQNSLYSKPILQLSYLELSANVMVTYGAWNSSLS